MTAATLTLLWADDSTLSYVQTLLERNGVPSRDVRSKPNCSYIGYDGNDAIGVGGIETHGTGGLLRSVVVERSARGTGYGTV
ncbi:GNAT family N-acetyltransferase [Haladaptatus caseinilyticus]|uniref:hypothetical protein n=1 Tax=Haladaptatus caseinilyticus TaxID=2993314 RepID=UPI002E2395DB